MRDPIDKYLQRLGVEHVLAPYETRPWMFYDEVRGITCSAEVRMGPGHEDIEAEIQFVYDDGTEHEDAEGNKKYGGIVQIMRMRALPVATSEWSTTDLLVKGEDYKNKIYNWEEKGCNFFRACIQAVQMNELPDVEELIERELGDDDDFGGGRRGRIGRKSPKVKPAALLGMKKGM